MPARPARPRHAPHQYVVALVCLGLILGMFAAMAVTAQTGDQGWLITVMVLDFAAVLAFAFFAPDRWRD